MDADAHNQEKAEAAGRAQTGKKNRRGHQSIPPYHHPNTTNALVSSIKNKKTRSAATADAQISTPPPSRPKQRQTKDRDRPTARIVRQRRCVTATSRAWRPLWPWLVGAGGSLTAPATANGDPIYHNERKLRLGEWSMRKCLDSEISRWSLVLPAEHIQTALKFVGSLRNEWAPAAVPPPTLEAAEHYGSMTGSRQ